jgi:hypothetical protein
LACLGAHILLSHNWYYVKYEIKGMTGSNLHDAFVLGLVAVLAGAASPVGAHALSPQECFEGGDFIAHAAQSRDNGMNREAFLGKLVDDIRLIQALPPSLRWFVVDPDDALFLHAAVTEIFDAPKEPELHRAHFLSQCFDR